jgi:hypothetical protein
MRSRSAACVLMLVFVLAAGTLASGGSRNRPERQWAIAYLIQPTLVGDTFVQGPVLFTHDDARMARGEPCTTVHLFEPGTGPLEEVAAFHCIPTRRATAGKFTIRTRPNDELGFGCILTEYQFAGDDEGHGVPTSVKTH